MLPRVSRAQPGRDHKNIQVTEGMTIVTCGNHGGEDKKNDYFPVLRSGGFFRLPDPGMFKKEDYPGQMPLAVIFLPIMRKNPVLIPVIENSFANQIGGRLLVQNKNLTIPLA